MSTTYKLVNQQKNIILRFWGGYETGTIIRFGFDEDLLHLISSAEVIGSDGELTTIGKLHASGDTVEFLSAMDSRYQFFKRTFY
jgi:hypothetical protein